MDGVNQLGFVPMEKDSEINGRGDIMTKKMKAFKEKCRKNEFDDYQYIFMKNKDDRLDSCHEFMDKLQDILQGKYEIVPSCNKDNSSYLIPIGTSDQITYYGKPILSFRMSDHWNWYSNIRKCSDPDYIQCNCTDLPRAKKRYSEVKGTNPIRATMVAIQLSDGNYHHVFGEKYYRKTRTWAWEESNPEDICQKFGLA